MPELRDSETKKQEDMEEKKVRRKQTEGKTATWRIHGGMKREGEVKAEKKTVKVKCQECKEKVGGGVGARP